MKLEAPTARTTLFVNVSRRLKAAPVVEELLLPMEVLAL
jgi:hypothetical protein